MELLKDKTQTEKQADELLKRAVSEYRKYHSVRLTFFLFSDELSKDKTLSISELPLPENLIDQRRAVLHAMGHKLGNDGLPITAIGSISEAWASINKDTPPQVMPSDDPNKREIIFAALMSRSGECITHTKEIVSENGLKLLRDIPELKTDEKGMTIESNLLNEFWSGFYGICKSH